MLHLPTAIVRWETPASFLFPLFIPNQPPVSGRRRSELPLSITVTHSTRQECLVHTEHEILIFLYFEHQTAVRPKPAKHGSEPEPKQVKHGNQVIADRLCRLPCEVVDFTAGQDCDEEQVIVGAIGVPLAMPVLSPESYIRCSERLHVAPPRIETNKLGPLPQFYADMVGCEESTAEVAHIYNYLSPDVRPKTAIFCGNYGQAGAIDRFGRKYGLPDAISTHQSRSLSGIRKHKLGLAVGDT